MPTPVESRTSWPRHYGKRVEQPNARQRDVLARLAELTVPRRELVSRKAYMTATGREEYDRVLTKIRAQIERGVGLGIGHEQMREALELTSTAYYKIKSGKTGS
jgi:hypothetical protein